MFNIFIENMGVTNNPVEETTILTCPRCRVTNKLNVIAVLKCSHKQTTGNNMPEHLLKIALKGCLHRKPVCDICKAKLKCRVYGCDEIAITHGTMCAKHSELCRCGFCGERVAKPFAKVAYKFMCDECAKSHCLNCGNPSETEWCAVCIRNHDNRMLARKLLRCGCGLPVFRDNKCYTCYRAANDANMLKANSHFKAFTKYRR